MSDIPEFLKNSKPSRIEVILRNPILQFSFGCIVMVVGLIYWQTGISIEYWVSININPLVGIFITGLHLMVGYLLIGSNYQTIIDKIQNHRSVES